MDGWSIFFNVLLVITNIGILTCTSVGFYFIWKQIKITKNKEILFSLRKDINLLMDHFREEFFDLDLLFKNVINDWYIDNISKYKEFDFMNKFDHSKTLGNTLTLVIDKYEMSPPNTKYMSLTFYDQWLSGLPKLEFEAILNSKEFERIHKSYVAYKNIISTLNLNKINFSDDVSINKQALGNQIFEMLKVTAETHSSDFNNVKNKFDTLLTNLAKNKSIFITDSL